MDYLMWFLKLRLLSVRNSLWIDKNRIMRTVKIGIIIICAQILLVYLFKNYIFDGLLPSGETGTKALLLILFTGVVIWIYFISFVDSISNIIRNLYRSPDLNYLMSLPVPVNNVFMSKYAEYIFNSIKVKIFIIFPFLAAMGWSVSAPWFFYLLIIPFYFLISIIPCTIGIIIGMLSLRVISTKILTKITMFLSFAINIVFVVILSDKVKEISPLYIKNLMEFIEKPFISDIVPVTAGVRILFFSAFQEPGGFFASLSSFAVITFLFIIFIFFLSRKLFYEGWSKSQHSESKVYKMESSKSGNLEKTYSNSAWSWIKGEWKMALRNHEMLMGAFLLLLFFGITLILFIFKGYLSANPLLALYILIGIAVIFNIMAVSIPFNPIEIAADKSLTKKRFWLLKVMPLNGLKIFHMQCTMIFIPGYLISLLGITIFSAVKSIPLPVILISGLALLVILYGSAALYTALEIMLMEKFFEDTRFVGDFLSIVLPVVYGVLSVGPMILFILKDIPVDIWMVSRLSNVLSLPYAIAASAVTVIITFLLSRRISAAVWDKIEI